MRSIDFITILQDVGAEAGKSTPFTPEDFLNKLFPNFWSWLINFVALIILFIFVYKFAYKALKKYTQARKDYIEHNIKDSEQAKIISERNAEESSSLIVSARKEADGIVMKAKDDAKIQAEQIKHEAEDAALKKLKDADIAIEQAEIKSRNKMQSEIIDVAMDASRKVLGREINDKDNRRLVSDFIRDIEPTKGDK